MSEEEDLSISTHNLAAIPDLVTLQRLCQSVAVLDAILQPDVSMRYFTFDAHWGDEGMMGRMTNGSGDEYFVVFSPFGAIIKGFDHESPMSPYNQLDHQVWPGMFENIPPELGALVRDPALSPDDITFCIWRRVGDSQWSIGPIDFPETDREVADGSDWMLFVLDGQPGTYHDWAQDYYSREMPLNAIEAIYQHQPLTEQFARQLKPDVNWPNLQRELKEIGYPVA